MKTDFDFASNNYDTLFTFSNIGKAQRKRVFHFINPILKQEKKLSILELNCGTGTDAITIGKLGHDVIATDISEGMINKAKSKQHTKNVKFKTLDINTISETTFNKKFDIIFSNFGGLNCLSKLQLTLFIEKSNRLLNSNGKLIMVIMPKKCLWERFYFTLKGSLKKANRRNTFNNIIANVEGTGVKTWYYNPDEIIAVSSSLYSRIIVKPIGLFIPPSYLENSFISKKQFLNILIKLESFFTSTLFSKYADHFLIILSKKKAI